MWSTAIAALLLATTTCAAVPDSFNTQAPTVSDDRFRRCVCWRNDTAAMCEDWSTSSSCGEWEAAALWPLLPAALLAAALLLFPALFPAGRYLCNCCGGRDASYGCCYPVPSRHIVFPGYAAATVTRYRMLLTGSFLITVALVAVVVRLGALWADGLRSAVTAFDAPMATHRARLQAAATFAGALPHTPSGTDALLARVAQFDASGLTSVARTLQAPFSVGGDSDLWPAQALDVVAALPLLVLLCVALLVWRGRAGPTVAAAASVYAVCVALLLCAAGAFFGMAVVADAACRNFDVAVLPVATGSMRTIGACGDVTVATVAAAALADFGATVRNPASMACVSLRALHSSNFTIVDNPCGAASQVAPHTLLRWFGAALRSSHRAARDGTVTTIEDCAFLCGDRGAAAAATYLGEFRASTYDNVAALQPLALTAGSCAAAAHSLRSTFAPILCSTTPRSVLRGGWHVAAALAACVCVALLTLVVLVRGVKRFTHDWVPRDDLLADESWVSAAYGTMADSPRAVVGVVVDDQQPLNH
jgi:hypothetical protein